MHLIARGKTVREAAVEVLTGVAEFVRTKARKDTAGYTFGVYGGAPAGSQERGLMNAEGDVKKMVKAFRSLVFACVHARAVEVANAGQRGAFKVQVEKGMDDYTDVPMGHPLLELLRNPNKHFSRMYFWYLTSTYLDLAGNAYWWVGEDRLRVARSLWLLPPQNVRIVPGDPSKGEPLIKGYIVDWGAGKTFPVPEEQIVHLRVPNPNDPYYYGSSLLMKAAVEVDIAEYIAVHQRDFFANAAIPAGIVTFPKPLAKDQRLAFEEQWLKKFKRKPGQVGYLDGGATYTPMVNQKELDYLNSAGVNRKVIQSVFGVPDSRLMIEENITARATMETLESNFLKQTIEPILTMIDEQLTLDLAKKRFDEKLVVRHESMVPKDQRLQAELDQQYLDMGVYSINEVRTEQGLDEIAGGDEPLVSAALVPLSNVAEPEGVELTELEPEEEVEEEEEEARAAFLAKAKLTDGLKAAAWKSHEALRAKWERHCMALVKRVILKTGAEVVAKIKQGEKREATEEEIRAASGVMFDMERFMDALKRVLTAEAYRMVQEGFKQFVRQYQVQGVVYSPADPRVVKGVYDLARKTKTVAEGLRGDLAKEITRGLELHEAPEVLAKRVQRFYGKQAGWRAMRVARTNVNFAINKGNEIAAKLSGQYDRKIWLTQRDAAVRDPLHTTMDGVTTPIDAKFKLVSGDLLDVPGDPQARDAASVVNCRCSVLFLRKKALTG